MKQKVEDYNKKPRLCKNCDNPISYEQMKRSGNTIIFCSISCGCSYRGKHNRDVYNQNPLLCENCNEPILYEKTIGVKNPKFCSKSCAAKVNNRKKKHTEETKRHLKSINLGKKHTPKTIEKLKNRKHTPEEIQKISSAAKERMKDPIRKAVFVKNTHKHLGLFLSPSSRGLANYDTYEPQLRKYEEHIRRAPGDEQVLEVQCHKCKEWIQPRQIDVHNRLLAIGTLGNGECHFYCPGSKCRNSCEVYGKLPIPPRPEEQLANEVPSEVSQVVRKRAEGVCERCKEKLGVHCHHTKPRKCEGPGYEADIDDCLWVCLECHLVCHEKDGCTFGYLAYAEFDRTPSLA
jgi:hypothetical protein